MNILSHVFSFLIKPFLNRGLGQKVRPVIRSCKVLTSLFKTASISVNGYNMVICSKADSNISDLSITLLFHHVYEPYTTEICKKIIQPGWICVDIGANIGYFTLLFSQLTGENGLVYAFEPDPDSYGLLINNMNMNHCKNIIPIQSAVLDQPKQVKLFKYDEPGLNSIYNTQAENSYSLVDAISLDQFFIANNSGIHVIKIDIEGAELLALRGMNGILSNNNVNLFAEFNPHSLMKAGVSPHDYWAEIKKHGFMIYVIDEIRHELMSMNCGEAIEFCRGNNVNLFCNKSCG